MSITRTPAPQNAHLKRIVIKVGTSSLITDGEVDQRKLATLVEAVAKLRTDGHQILLVASGAIALGDVRLNRHAEGRAGSRQLAAAIGQGLLFDAFRCSLEENGLQAAQFLLTPFDLTGPDHRDGVRDALEEALDRGWVPVVNENDAVMVRNNDVLASLLSATLGAGLLVLLTDVSGLYESDPRQSTDARRIPVVDAMTPEVEHLAGSPVEGPGTGGMPTKLCAVWIATLAGVACVIAGASVADSIEGAVRGENVGTLVRPRQPKKRADLGQLWRALSAAPTGRLLCNPSAVAAAADGRPLTKGHVQASEGNFKSGDVVDVVVDSHGVIARGRSSVAAPDMSQVAPRQLADGQVVLHPSDYISLLES
ncbi:glutamate 5-kinase [Streptomyces sp. Edi2]|uniref:glutamate 5-kinase n=1 Tax=Streptomyces sp. Edi2 TaxID=3162528 RepID=UPI003305DFD9